jgi:hypothetical protein
MPIMPTWRSRRPAWRGAGWWLHGSCPSRQGELAGIFPVSGQRIGLRVGKKLDRPGQPRWRSHSAAKARAVRLDELGDAALIGLGRGGGEGQRDLAKPQLEQAVAAPRLAVIVALGRRPAEDFDLAGVEPEPLVDGRDLRLDRALVRQEDARRAALDDGGRDVRALDVGEALGGEDDAGVLLAQRLQPFAELRGELRASSASQPSSMMMSVGEPSSRPSIR